MYRYGNMAYARMLYPVYEELKKKEDIVGFLWPMGTGDSCVSPPLPVRLKSTITAAYFALTKSEYDRPTVDESKEKFVSRRHSSLDGKTMCLCRIGDS